MLFKRAPFLYDQNVELLSLCLKWLRWNVTVRETSTYEKVPEAGVFDLRSVINVKNEENLPKFYRPATYHQVFGNTFVENASVIDLVFCAGPQAAHIVQASAVQK